MRISDWSSDVCSSDLSTLLKSILGLQPVRSGCIEFMGERIERRAPDGIIRRGISIVPEGRRVFPDFTVAENLAIGARARRSTSAEMQEDIDKIMSQFPRLKERWKKKAGTMSGGENGRASCRGRVWQ